MATMKLIAFNVGQGQCVYVRTPDDYGILIDCGRGGTGPAESPAAWLADNEMPSLTKWEGNPFAAMIVTHPHNNHVADIDTVIRRLSPAMLYRDSDYDWQSVMSPIGGLDQSLRTYREWESEFASPQPDLDLGVSLRTFSLSREEAERIGGNPWQIINNRSIVTVISYRSLEGYAWKVVIAGDNEASGWEALLDKPDFCTEIEGADFFVASDHGRESGFCGDLFKVMGKPLANIICTHEGDDVVEEKYRRQGKGVKFPDGSRKHFITRDDGNITLEMHDDGRYDAWLFRP